MQPVCQILVEMHPDGRVGLQVNGPPNGVMILGMLEQAKAMVLRQQEKAAAAAGVEVAPPALVNRLNGKH